MNRLVALGSFLIVASLTERASAQLGPLAGPPLLPPTPIVAPDTSIAVAVDPAALAFLSGFGLYYAHADAPDAARVATSGDSVYLAGSFRRKLGLGLGFERARPSLGAAYGRFSLGISAAAGRRAAFGFALRHVAIPGSPDATAIDFSTTIRPLRSLGFAVVAGNVLGPAGLAATGGLTMPATFTTAVTWRPLGTNDVVFDAAAVFDTDRRVGGRFYAGLGFGAVRFTGLFEVQRIAGTPDYRGLVGAELFYRALRVAGGAALASPSQGPGFYVGGGVDFGVDHTPSVPPPHILELDVEGSVGERRILALALALERGLQDPATAGVLLRLRQTKLGLAQAQELHQLVAAFVAAGKPVVCHFEDPHGSELYACANATRTLVDPAGHVRLVGPSVHVILLGGLLSRIGVHADFVRVGEYKSAPEQLMNEGLSAPAREQEDALIGDLYARLVGDLARDRGMSEAAMAALIDRGPFTAAEAVRFDLVDATADGAVLGDELRSVFGRSLRRRGPSDPLDDRSFGVGPRVAVVVVDGSIVDGENVDIPFVDIHASGADTIVAALDRLASDSSVESVVLRVDSGGGSALASDRIYRAVRRLAARKPVVASLGGSAASGGYYVAAAANEIYCDPSTVTGSIGVFFGKVDVATLADKIGVHVEEFRRGAHAGADSITRPFTDDERARLTELIEATYRMFLERVAEGRRTSVDAIEPLARGRVYSGDAALRVGLVDRLGGIAAAVARARELGRLDADAEVLVVPARPRTLLEYLVGANDSPRVRDATRDHAAHVPTALVRPFESVAALAANPDGAVFALPSLVIEE